MKKDTTSLFLEAWHRAAKEKNIDLMDPFTAENVALLSPALFHPKVGKTIVYGLLRDVLTSFKSYEVTKTWIDGNDIILEFDALIGSRKIQGIDRITLNNEGKLIQLKVFIRPFSGLQALISSMIDIEMTRAQQNMTYFEKLKSKILFTLKSKWHALTKA